jgi:hypothetical protein
MSNMPPVRVFRIIVSTPEFLEDSFENGTSPGSRMTGIPIDRARVRIPELSGNPGRKAIQQPICRNQQHAAFPWA